MNEAETEIKELDRIVDRILQTIEKSKSEIYTIYETTCGGISSLEPKLKQITQQKTLIMQQLDNKSKQKKEKLTAISTFNYEEANKVAKDVAAIQAEKDTIEKKAEKLENRLQGLEEAKNKSERLGVKIGAVLDYLGTQRSTAVEEIESVQQNHNTIYKIIQALEDERYRVSRDIHDGPAQAMANVIFMVDLCNKLLTANPERAKQELNELREQVDGCLTEIRKIIFDLRPMTLDDLGLIPTVKRIAEMMRERTGSNVEVTVNGKDTELDSHIEIALFRVIQESLNNVEKHANAKKTIISIRFMADSIEAAIEDDGDGFEPGNGQAGCFGLIGMQERISLLKGKLDIHSRKGKGTKIAITIPR